MTNEIIEMIKDTEITMITKKRRKEFKVYVSDVWDNGKVIVGWYTNRFGKLDLKQFNMNEYDFCL